MIFDFHFNLDISLFLAAESDWFYGLSGPGGRNAVFPHQQIFRSGVVHKLCNHFWGSRKPPPPPSMLYCNHLGLEPPRHSLVPQPTCYWNSFLVNMHQWYPLIWCQLNNETHAQMFDDSAISPGVFEDYWQEQPYLITVSTKQIFCCINVFTNKNVLTDNITTKKRLLRW